MWGFQIECNGLGYATSYIPTLAATATRLKDQLQYAGGANIGGEDIGQGTIVMDVLFDDYDLLDTGYFLAISDGGSFNDRISVLTDITNDNLRCTTAASGGNAGVSAVAGDIIDNEIHNIRLTYKTNKLTASVDGVPDASPDTLVDIPDDLDQIDIGQNLSGALQPACLIRNIRIYSDPDVEL